MKPRLARALIALAALLLALATIAGAAASHALAGTLDASALSAFQTGVQFQFFHALGLMALALYAERRPESWLMQLAAAGLTAGILLFCGGVYAGSLGGPRWLAQLAPIGGVTLIVSWLVVAGGAARSALGHRREPE